MAEEYRYNFAWVDESEPFGPDVIRRDEDVFSFKLNQAEGDFATLEVEIVNPRVGLLAVGRKRWVWFSVTQLDEVSASESSEQATLALFKGRIVGLPKDFDGETVSLTFTARPSNFEDQKKSVATAKAVAPFFDPIWFKPDDVSNPDNILEFRPELWNVDRVTHEVTTTNIVNGEDGTILLNEDNVLADSVRITFGQAPVGVVNVVATVTWDQKAQGEVDISQLLNTQWGAIVTYTGDKLVENWPKPGANIGAGWKFGTTFIRRVNAQKSLLVRGAEYLNDPVVARPPTEADKWESLQLSQPVWTFDLEESRFTIMRQYFGGFIRIVPYAAHSWRTGFDNLYIPPHSFWVPKQTFHQITRVAYDVSRGRTETVSFSLAADVQPIVSDPEGTDVLDLSFSSSEIVSPVDPDGEMPLGKPSNSVYFSSERGTQSVESLLMMARAQILARSRCVDIELECLFDFGLYAGLSCRKNVMFTDSELPGGVAAGKITEYTLSLDGDSGVAACDITFSCTVGRGGAVTGAIGNPVWCDDGYVNDGYQRREGSFTMPVAGEIAYQSIEGLPANDDGINFDRMTPFNVVKSLRRVNDMAVQEAAMAAPMALEPGEIIDALNTVPLTYTLELVPLTTGPFQTDFVLDVSDLKIPQTINLEATP